MTETDPETTADTDNRLLLVTGVSGAGKSSALKALEDLGYEAVDNVPMSLMGRLVAPNGDSQPVAIGIDVRTRDFRADLLLGEIETLAADGGVAIRILFVDCDDDILQRRFAETRRRHPLALDRPVSDGLRRERQLMAPLRERADVRLDTSDMSLGDMKRVLEEHFGAESAPGLSIFVTSFSFRKGVPRDADLVFDVRFLRNPYYEEALRPLSGRDAGVAAYVSADEGFTEFFDNLTALLAPLLPRYAAEGKSYLTIAMGCTGGQHRSVFLAESLAAWLRQHDHHPQLLHRDLDKSAN